MKTLILLAALAAAASAQTMPGPMGSAGTANLPEQRIRANDLIAVSVYDAPELTRTIRVSSDGSITLPMIKRRIQAENLMPGELQEVLAETLKTERILVDPLVVVTVVEYQSRAVSVVGAVRKPVTFQAVGPVTLLEAISRAEGLDAGAGPEIVVSRPVSGGPPEILRIPVRRLIDQAENELNFTLTGGEEIRVPEARKVYVVGNVRKSGAFPVREGFETSVLKVLALAEGLAPFAAKQAYVYRLDADQQRQEVAIELDKIMQRKSPDVVLRAEDILYIPDNKGRRTAAGILEKVAGFGVSTASGVLVWRR